VVSPAGSVRVEVLGRHAVVLEVPAGRGIRPDGAGGRDVVGGHRGAEVGEDAGVEDVPQRLRLGAQLVEVRRAANVGGGVVPVERLGLAQLHRLPVLVPGEHIGVAGGEHVRLDVGVDGRLDLGGAGPDVA